MRYTEVLVGITLSLSLSWIILLTENSFLIRSKSGFIVGRQCLLLTIDFYELCNYGYQYVTMDIKQKLS